MFEYIRHCLFCKITLISIDLFTKIQYNIDNKLAFALKEGYHG